MMIGPAALSTYEALRTQVLSQGPGGPLGWAVFLRRGMLAWCLLWDRPREIPAPAPRAAGPSRFEPGVVPHCGVIGVLAAMVLALQPELTHDV